MEVRRGREDNDKGEKRGRVVTPHTVKRSEREPTSAAEMNLNTTIKGEWV